MVQHLKCTNSFFFPSESIFFLPPSTSVYTNFQGDWDKGLEFSLWPQPLGVLGATSHSHISKIWDMSLPLYGGTPFNTSHSYGYSHHQCLFCFWAMLRSPPLCFPHFSTSWKALLNSGAAKRAQWIFFLTPDHSGYFPPLTQTITCSFWQSVHPKSLPFSPIPASLPFFFPNSPGAGRSWNSSALGSKLLSETTQHHLLKPSSLCAAPDTNILIKTFELSCSTHLFEAI